MRVRRGCNDYILNHKHRYNFQEGFWNEHVLREILKLPILERKLIATCMSFLITESPSKECRPNKLPPTGRIRERSTGRIRERSTVERRCQSICPPRILLAGVYLGWAMSAPPRRTLESEWLARDSGEANPTTLNPKSANHVAEQFSWIALPHCSLPGRPFPMKFLALSPRTTVSSNNSFLSVRKEPTHRPWKQSPFLQHTYKSILQNSFQWWYQQWEYTYYYSESIVCNVG